MEKIKRRNYSTAGGQIDEVCQAYELRWLCYDYAIAGQPTGSLATIWKFRSKGKIQRGVQEQKAPWPEGGVFVPKEMLIPNGSAPKPNTRYNPANYGPEILLDVQRTSSDNPASLLRFVNQWGRLGVGIPEDREFPYDGVLWTGKFLEEITWWIQSYQALQEGRRARANWSDLISFLNGALTKIHPEIRKSKKWLAPGYHLSALIDALWLECWDLATYGKELRRCPECPACFLPGRTDQIYCTHRCAIRPTVRKAKLKKKQHEREVRIP